MNLLYRIASTAAVLPAAGLCLVKTDLRGSIVRRFIPKPVQARHPERKRIWIHAASAGEVQLARHFAEELARHERMEILLTTNTDSGFQNAQNGGFDHVRHFPFDVAPAIARLFNSFKPQALVLIEMELWPGLLLAAERRGVPTLVVNARMGQASIGAYRKLNRRMEDVLSRPYYLGRTDIDVTRLAEIGVPIDHTLITGEMKIDATLARVEGASSLETTEQLLLAVSTHSGEDEIILDAYERIRDSYPEARLVLAPRHQRRCAALLTAIAKRGFAAAPADDLDPDDLAWADVVVENGFGRMARWYALARLVFVGGSLVEAGGHNLLEPVLFSRPVIVGPHSGEWSHWVDLLDEAGAASVVRGAEDISRVASIVFDELPNVARQVDDARRRLLLISGATARNTRILIDLLNGENPFGLDAGQ